jgi:hypothetical protein
VAAVANQHTDIRPTLGDIAGHTCIIVNRLPTWHVIAVTMSETASQNGTAVGSWDTWCGPC